MSEPAIDKYQSLAVIDARERFGDKSPPGPPIDPPSGGGGDDMEARVRVLESHIDHIREGIARIERMQEAARSDLSAFRSEHAKLATDTAVHTALIKELPSKTFVVQLIVGTVTLAGAILTLLSRSGLLLSVK